MTLNSAAPGGGATVTLSSNSASLTVPASVLVPAGATSATFTATGASVTAGILATITATFNAAALTSSLTLNPPSVSVTIGPGSATLWDSQSQQFTATVAGGSNTSVTWQISPLVGSISTTGLYTAPAMIGATQTVTATATSAASSSAVASATIALIPTVWLTWTASTSSGVVGYNVYRSGTSGGPYTRINNSVVSVTNFHDLNVSRGNYYYYVMTAVNASSQESSYSTQVQVLEP